MYDPNDTTCNYLFNKSAKKKKFKKYIRCELCKYAEKQEGLPEHYIHCTKYPNMISFDELTCKSSELRK